MMGDVAEVPDDIVKTLYTAPPQQFVAARDAAVSAAGDPAQAKAVAALRKPTVAAWLVNLVAHERPDLIGGLAELATSLRAAQRELRGAQLRELSSQRRSVVAALVNEAKSLAVKTQPDLNPSKLPLTEVETTFSAALADEQLAATVRAGRLTKTTAYAGFGELPTPDAEPKPGKPARAAAAVPAKLLRDLADAQKAEEAAQTALTDAAGGEQELLTQLDEIDEALRELEERRDDLREQLSRRRHTHKFAKRALAAASRQLSEAQTAVERAGG